MAKRSASSASATRWTSAAGMSGPPVGSGRSRVAQASATTVTPKAVVERGARGGRHAHMGHEADQDELAAAGLGHRLGQLGVGEGIGQRLLDHPLAGDRRRLVGELKPGPAGSNAPPARAAMLDVDDRRAGRARQRQHVGQARQRLVSRRSAAACHRHIRAGRRSPPPRRPPAAAASMARRPCRATCGERSFAFGSCLQWLDIPSKRGLGERTLASTPPRHSLRSRGEGRRAGVVPLPPERADGGGVRGGGQRRQPRRSRSARPRYWSAPRYSRIAARGSLARRCRRCVGIRSLFRVLAAIDLDHQPMLVAGEIRKIGTDRRLPAPVGAPGGGSRRRCRHSFRSASVMSRRSARARPTRVSFGRRSSAVMAELRLGGATATFPPPPTPPRHSLRSRGEGRRARSPQRRWREGSGAVPQQPEGHARPPAVFSHAAPQALANSRTRRM